MNSYLLVAGVLAVLVGLIHSVLGEVLIFSKLRKGTLVPCDIAYPLKERHIRIIWASWHIVSLFGFGFAAILFLLSVPEYDLKIAQYIIIIAMFLSSLLVCYSTKAKHPGWIGLLMISLLVWLS